jgi:3-oxoacyl-[acyl-carrier-protein] synthase-1
MSSPHPEGMGARLAMQRALDTANLPSHAIDYINLHGTATKANDASEDQAVCALFGDRLPASSTKGATGHLLGAAGVTEALISILAIEHDFLPGSPQTRHPDPALKTNYLLDNVNAPVRRVMSNSFGFGGSNCSLVFGATD